MKSQELRREYDTAVTEARRLSDLAKAETRDLTEDEADAFDAAMNLADDRLSAAKRAERLERAEDVLAAPVTRHVPDADPGTPSAPLPEQRRELAPRVTSPARHLRDARAWGATTREADANSFAADQWVRGMVLGRAEARQWLTENSPTEFRVMEAGNNLTGGYLVPPEMERVIIDLRETYGIARQLCRRVPMATDTISIPRVASDVTTYWVGEASTITASDPGFDQVQLTAKKLSALTRVSSELIEDSAFSIADFLAQHYGQKLAEAEDEAFIAGTGGSNTGGIVGVKGKLDANEAFAGVVTAASGNDTYSEITAIDLTSLLGVAPTNALPNGKWIASSTGFSVTMERLAHTAGGATVTSFEDGLRHQFMGYPVVISQKMPTSTADLSEQCMFLFGDFSAGVVFGERRGLELAQSSDVYFTSDEIALRATSRVDIGFFSYGDASTAGVVVGLMGD